MRGSRGLLVTWCNDHGTSLAHRNLVWQYLPFLLMKTVSCCRIRVVYAISTGICRGGKEVLYMMAFSGTLAGTVHTFPKKR